MSWLDIYLCSSKLDAEVPHLHHRHLQNTFRFDGLSGSMDYLGGANTYVSNENALLIYSYSYS